MIRKLGPLQQKRQAFSAMAIDRLRPQPHWSRWRLEDGPDGGHLRKALRECKSRERLVEERQQARRIEDIEPRVERLMRIAKEELRLGDAQESGKTFREALGAWSGHWDIVAGAREACGLAVRAHLEGFGTAEVDAAFGFASQMAAGFDSWDRVDHLIRIAAIRHELQTDSAQIAQILDAAREAAGELKDGYLRAKALCELAGQYAQMGMPKAVGCLEDAGVAMEGQTAYLRALLEIRAGEIYRQIGEREMAVRSLIAAADHAQPVRESNHRQQMVDAIDKALDQMGAIMRFKRGGQAKMPP